MKAQGLAADLTELLPKDKRPVSITPTERRDLVVALRKAADLLDRLPVFTSCTGCDHFRDNDYCQEWRSTVPKDSIDAGCDRWTDPIPF